MPHRGQNLQAVTPPGAQHSHLCQQTVDRGGRCRGIQDAFGCILSSAPPPVQSNPWRRDSPWLTKSINIQVGQLVSLRALSDPTTQTIGMSGSALTRLNLEQSWVTLLLRKGHIAKEIFDCQTPVLPNRASGKYLKFSLFRFPQLKIKRGE